MSEVKFIDNSQAFLKAKDEAMARALEAIGLTAERHAKEKCPVDTGRLRNSITHATNNYLGVRSYQDAKHTGIYFDGTAKAVPEKGSVYIGTNVEYAKYVEAGDSMRHTSGGAHFIRDAAANHNLEYRRIVVEQLKK